MRTLSLRLPLLSLLLTGVLLQPADSEQVQPAPLPDKDARTNPNNAPLPSGAFAQMRHEGPVQSVAFSPNGKLLASGGIDGTTRLWEAMTGIPLFKFERKKGIGTVAFSPDGNMLASGGDDKMICVWEISTGKELLKIEGQQSPICSVAFSPDGKTIASGALNGTIRLWDATTGSEKYRLDGHKGRVESVAFSPDGLTLASGSTPRKLGGKWVPDRTIRSWDVTSGHELLKFEEHQERVKSIAFSPDGKLLAAGGMGNTIPLLDATTGKVVRFQPTEKREIYNIEGIFPLVLTIAFSPDGKILASGNFCEHSVRIWDESTGKDLLSLGGHKGYVNSVAFSPDRRTLASGSVDTTVLIWDVAALLEGRK